jgi:hypothetical protein
MNAGGTVVETESEKDDGGLSGMTIVIIIFVVIFILLIIFFVFFFFNGSSNTNTISVGPKGSVGPPGPQGPAGHCANEERLLLTRYIELPTTPSVIMIPFNFESLGFHSYNVSINVSNGLLGSEPSVYPPTSEVSASPLKYDTYFMNSALHINFYGNTTVFSQGILIIHGISVDSSLLAPPVAATNFGTAGAFGVAGAARGGRVNPQVYRAAQTPLAQATPQRQYPLAQAGQYPQGQSYQAPRGQAEAYSQAPYQSQYQQGQSYTVRPTNISQSTQARRNYRR